MDYLLFKITEAEIHLALHILNQPSFGQTLNLVSWTLNYNGTTSTNILTNAFMFKSYVFVTPHNIFLKMSNI